MGNPASRQPVAATLQRLGYQCTEADDPYAGVVELLERPVYRSVILSLAGLYREELPIIAALKRRQPHLEVWLAQIEGRQAALVEAMRLGADGLLADDGLHRMAVGAGAVERPVVAEAAVADGSSRLAEVEADDEPMNDEPLLSADELRALLQEQPSMPPAGEESA